MARLITVTLLLVAVLFSGVSYGDSGVQWSLVKNGVAKRLNNRDNSFRDGNWTCSIDTPVTTDGATFRQIHCLDIVGRVLNDAVWCQKELPHNSSYPLALNGNQYVLACSM